VVVLSNNDGCIVARSNEAKALGINMGEPEFKVRDLLKQHNVAVFSSNYALYGDISNRVMLTVESLVPVVEQYSIDEAFVPLDAALAANADEIARATRERVRRWTGIVVSIGVGTTRTLAKLASEIAKKGDGLCRLDAGSPETEDVLARTPAGDIWGIGRKSALKLRMAGIYTARDVRDCDNLKIRALLNVNGLNTAFELRGVHSIEMADAPISRRTIISSRSFGARATEKEALEEALAMHATLAGERLRREKLRASGLAVHIRTSRHGNGPFYEQRANVSLRLPTADTRELVRAARQGLEAVFQRGYSYAKAGIMLYDLAPAEGGQTNLLELIAPPARLHEKELMAALDAVNRRFGRGTLRFAAEGKADAAWRMQHSRRSPRWTTVWDELPKV
jgi:DNA polymerase V